MRTDNLEKVFERTLTIEHSDLKPERSARREQNRKASARRPAQRKYGRVCLKLWPSGSGSMPSKNVAISIHFDRGNYADECEAIETFLADSLAKSR